MAIKPTGRSVNDFRFFYASLHAAVVLLISILATLLVTITVSILTTLNWQDTTLWLITIITFLGTAVLTGIMTLLLTKPLMAILALLIRKSGERTDLKPVMQNSYFNQKTGLDTVLGLITQSALPEPCDNKNSSDQPAETSFLTTALNQTECGIVVFDAQKRIIFANEAAPVISTLGEEPHLALDFLNEQSLSSWIDEVGQSEIRAHHSWRRIATEPEYNKKSRIFDLAASYQKGMKGETVVVLFDRSEQYIPEEEDLNFIAFAAHELRGPITVIRGYVDILHEELSGRLKDDEPELMNRLMISANRLSGYINNILNVAKFDRHHLNIHLGEDTVANIYNSIADDMNLRAKIQHRLLSVSIPDNLPTVAADHNSIGEVIGNLIDNAIKYSFEGGTVQVSAAQKGDFVEVSVTDNGVGMPAAVVKNLFHKFYRSHRSRESVAGTGIGLYISKAFVESHGGSITARSTENEGSTFSFTLPIYATVKDKLLEDGRLNTELIRHSGGWIKNHAMYRD